MKDKPRFMISILGLQKTIRWCSALGLPYFWIFLEGLNFTFSKISNGERTQMYGENPLLGRLGALYSSGGTLFFFSIRAFCEVPNLLWSSYSEKVVCQEEVWIWNDHWIHLLPR